MKDPAFLLYSKDFYEGTRTMLPEERACYMDLLIYQHQHNGVIPDNIRRILLYCSGIDESTLKATLEAKFQLTDKGWVNHKLNTVISDRENFSKKQSVNGTVGQFWKKCKSFLNATEYKKLRKDLSEIDNQLIFDFIKDKEILKGSLKPMLKAMLMHLVNANAIVNEDEDVIKNNSKEDSSFTKSDFKQTLLNHGAKKQHIDDWFKVRDKAKATYTKTILDNLLKQCSDNNYPVSEAVKLCAERGWRGFNYDWVKNNKGGDNDTTFVSNRN